MKDAGFYSPGDSWLHETHGTAKILVFGVAVPVATLLLGSWQWHVPVALGLVVVLATARIRRRQLLYFSPAVPLVLLTGLSWLVFANAPTSPPVWEFRTASLRYVLHENAAEGAAVAVMRGAIFALSYVALLTTTASRDLVAGLDKLGVPDGASRAVAMTLRFWSTVMDDTGRVADAQRARGMDLDEGPWWRGVGRRILATAMPTLFLMLKRFQTLNFALALRAMGARGEKSRLHAPRLRARDGALCAASVALLAVILVLDRGVLA